MERGDAVSNRADLQNQPTVWLTDAPIRPGPALVLYRHQCPQLGVVVCGVGELQTNAVLGNALVQLRLATQLPPTVSLCGEIGRGQRARDRGRG